MLTTSFTPSPKTQSAGLRSGVEFPALQPARDETARAGTRRLAPGNEWVTLSEGIHTVGYTDDTFHFDNEKTRAPRAGGTCEARAHLVTNAEWRAFMQDGGYATPTLWLMDGLPWSATSSGRRPATGVKVDGEWPNHDPRRI